MTRRSLIDDVEIVEEDDEGRPILFTNLEIRRMLILAGAGENIFWDLGCGWGQNLIVALTEFDVARAVGIKNDSSRKRKCGARLKRWQKSCPSLVGRWAVIEGDFERVLAHKTPDADLGNPTIVFYGLTTAAELQRVSGDARPVELDYLLLQRACFQRCCQTGSISHSTFRCTRSGSLSPRSSG